jgi:pyruvate ferredoxin oxidoreductase gamma subunit
MVSNDMVEIRWHGRGGQGAKMACLLLADVAGLEGKFVPKFYTLGWP